MAREAQRVAAATATSRAERVDAILDTTGDGIVVIDAQGNVESFNRGAQLLFGYPEAEVLGHNVSILMPSPEREEHHRFLERYLKTGKTRIIGIGRQREMRVSGERKFTGILHDLSGRVELEARLREQAALARLGEIAAVIAHEVKNPLAGIRGAIQVLGRRSAADTNTSQVLQEIVSRIDSLDQIPLPGTPARKRTPR